MCCKCLMQCYSSSNDSHLIFVRLPHHLQDRKRIVRTTFVNQTFQTVQPQESPFAHWISKHYTKMTKFSMDAIFSLPCCSLYLNIETINDLIKSVLVFIFLIFLTLALPSSNFSPALYMTALSGRLVRMKQIPWKQEMALTQSKNNRLTSLAKIITNVSTEDQQVETITHLCIGCKFHGSLSRHCITRVKHRACWDSAEHCEILQCHLWGAILTWTKSEVKKHFKEIFQRFYYRLVFTAQCLTNGNTTVWADQVDIRLGDRCHTDVVVSTSKESSKSAGEWNGAITSSTTNGHAHLDTAESNT